MDWGKLVSGIEDILFHPNGEGVFIASKRTVLEKDLHGKHIKEFENSLSNKIERIYFDIEKGELIVPLEEDKIAKWPYDDGQVILEEQEYYGHRILDVVSKKRLVYNEERYMIEYREKDKLDSIFSIPYISGMYISGCTFYNLHQLSEMSDDTKTTMIQYGGRFRDSEEAKNNEMQ